MELYSEDVLETNVHRTWWNKEKESKCIQSNSKKGKKRKREAALNGKMQDFSILVSNIFDECEPDSEAEEISDADSDFDELEE